MYFKPPSDRQLRLAAEERAGGSSWVVVGKKLHRSAETVRKWPLKFPERWKAAQTEAERQIAADAEGTDREHPTAPEKIAPEEFLRSRPNR